VRQSICLATFDRQLRVRLMGLVGVPRQLADKAKDAVSGFGSGGGDGGAVSPLAACYLSSYDVCA